MGQSSKMTFGIYTTLSDVLLFHLDVVRIQVQACPIGQRQEADGLQNATGSGRDGLRHGGGGAWGDSWSRGGRRDGRGRRCASGVFGQHHDLGLLGSREGKGKKEEKYIFQEQIKRERDKRYAKKMHYRVDDCQLLNFSGTKKGDVRNDMSNLQRGNVASERKAVAR